MRRNKISSWPIFYSQLSMDDLVEEEDTFWPPFEPLLGKCRAYPFILFQNLVDPNDRIEVAAGLARHLRPYQKEGVRFLFEKCFGRQDDDRCKVAGAFLADDMGLGKTVQTIALMSAVLGKSQLRETDKAASRRVRFERPSPLKFLVISPASVLHNWRDELDQWGCFAVERYHGPEREAVLRKARSGHVEVVLTTFDTARLGLDDLNTVKWDTVIVDECHKLKEPNTQITQALKNLKSRRRIGLTGTLLQNKYDNDKIPCDSKLAMC